MPDIPMLFSKPMVLALLEGRKTQTRRMHFNTSPNGNLGWVGDTIWVRENLFCEQEEGWCYRADGKSVIGNLNYGVPPIFLRDKNYIPSIHMPRYASRISLEVVSVRKEPLQRITEEDAKAEGISLGDGIGDITMYDGIYRDAYGVLWDKINGKTYPWSMNPFVVVITFKVVKP